MKSEPVVTVATITAGIAALLALVIAFGINLSDNQQQAIIGFVAVVGPLVAAYFQRQRVTPVAGMPATNAHIAEPATNAHHKRG